MAESKTDRGLKARLEQVQSTLKRVQAESERVVGRIRKDAGTLSAGIARRRCRISWSKLKNCAAICRSAPSAR